MTSEEFIRELKEAVLKIELSNKRILFMHPEDIAILDLDKVSSSLYLVEERRLEHAFALNVVSTINGEQYSQEVSCKLNEVDMGRNGNYYKLSSTFFGKCQNSDKLYVSAFKNGGSWTGVTIRGIFIPVD